ncbi:Fe3+-hydroxamate ABC transporter permease FhuB [Methylopila jiangsuensis]|uniref:Fe3+-hydroxamate ABC transporter permease FhuB n=1 Tax=Methylopila jiangsuensis TaxID=586230 RepID=A0A9W6JH29_9HYPH|nr:Fe(3+)-hydroxamate ABC transporter permease FhuB [Methylopila jiangsuensis]MDR6286139.1 iron complex transport system permease protein [Methylopila jiangsuensis]GLK75899.1 Fe3+-hydroxamate ABC transporter permease FhuB [Methylopila jiangsuensis]
MPDAAARRLRPLLLWTALAGLAAALSLGPILSGFSGGPVDQAFLLYSALPRSVVALLAGAALGLSGALLQQALDNPLAEPSTLGVFAGAQLALGLTAAFAPELGSLGREGAAFLGGAAAAALVLALGWRRKLDPVTVVLCGMVVAMVASSLTAALILARGDYLFALLIWGGGALTQEGWRPSVAIGVVLLLGALASAALARPLAVLVAGEASARSLGAPAPAIRIAALGVGVLLATTVAAEIGLIAFVGLAAPTLARLGGARGARQVLAAAPAIGAVLLWLADGLARQIGSGEAIPTGAATAVIGAPLLLWLLPRLRLADRPAAAKPSPRRNTARVLAVMAGVALAALAAGLMVGRDPSGWTLVSGAAFTELLPFRAPRTLAAASAGAMLAAAGVILQRLTGNPLAGPEVLGVGAGAGVGLAVVYLTGAGVSLSLQTAGSALGALAALVILLGVSGRTLGPERMLLAGAGISALCLAGLNAVIATGSLSAFALLAWMSGATDAVGPREAMAACAAAVALIAPLGLTLRWLETLQLGAVTARALGLRVRAASAALAGLASLLTAAAALIAGPLSFVGLVAPHLAHASGLTRAGPHLAGAVLVGAALTAIADLLARTLIAPYQLPLGLFASLLGGVYLMVLLRRR